jgi:RND family efflux transporter MFP subunit
VSNPSVPSNRGDAVSRAPAAPESNEPQPRSTGFAIPYAIAAGTLAVLALGGTLLVRAEARTDHVALASRPKPVGVATAAAAAYRPTRTYVGTLAPWIEAKVGPQLASGFVDTVLVRPGARVKRGEVLATLDCRHASAQSQAVAAQARALDARLHAVSAEAARVHGLLDGGFVAQNDAEQKEAQSAAQAAELAAQRAKLSSASLEVDDCVLRAPFEGEIAARTVDPGAFVRPGATIVTVVDRTTVRLAGDAPESDFGIVAPGTPVRVRLVATGKDVAGSISRRTPAADASTRTIAFEIDLPDAAREIPVGTTGEIAIDVGAPAPATSIPLTAATVRGSKATVFVVEGDVAHARAFAVKGEADGALFLDPALAAGSVVVTEGRALLSEGDRVAPKVEEPPAKAAPPKEAGK